MSSRQWDPPAAYKKASRQPDEDRQGSAWVDPGKNRIAWTEDQKQAQRDRDHHGSWEVPDRLHSPVSGPAAAVDRLPELPAHMRQAHAISADGKSRTKVATENAGMSVRVFVADPDGGWYRPAPAEHARLVKGLEAADEMAKNPGDNILALPESHKSWWQEDSPA